MDLFLKYKVYNYIILICNLNIIYNVLKMFLKYFNVEIYDLCIMLLVKEIKCYKDIRYYDFIGFKEVL